MSESELDDNFDDLRHREGEVAAQAELPESDTAFGATKEPEQRNDTAAVDIKAKGIERDQQAARAISFDQGRHAAESIKLTPKYERPAPRVELQHEPGCLWRPGATDPDAYGPPSDVCTCGPWPVAMPSTPWSFAWDTWQSWYVQGSWWVDDTDDKIPPRKAVHGTADRRSRALEVGTEGAQRSQIEYRMAALGASHGATPSQRPIYNDAGYNEASRSKLGIDSMLVWRSYLGPLVWGEHLIDCLEGTDEGIAACRASKKCHYCGAYFVAKHGKAKFCSDAHRQRFHHNGAIERPRLRCDEIFEIPKAPVAIPVRVPSHDTLCKSRREAAGDHICTCGMKWEKAVTIRLRLGAKKPEILPKYKGGQPMAA
jgi:hypothetical protein